MAPIVHESALVVNVFIDVSDHPAHAGAWRKAKRGLAARLQPGRRRWSLRKSMAPATPSSWRKPVLPQLFIVAPDLLREHDPIAPLLLAFIQALIRPVQRIPEGLAILQNGHRKGRRQGQAHLPDLTGLLADAHEYSLGD